MKTIIVRHVFSDEEWAKVRQHMKEKEVRAWLADVGMTGFEEVLYSRRNEVCNGTEDCGCVKCDPPRIGYK